VYHLPLYHPLFSNWYHLCVLSSVQERDSSPLYSRRLHVRVTASLGASALATAVATGEEADDDTAELDNGADDGLKDAADTADDGHDGISDGLETRLDLFGSFVSEMLFKGSSEAVVAYARDNTAHFG
jgi:hypothetical protein